MQTVITADEARRITGGRTPLLPVEYEQALKLLAECTTIDEAKYWSTKADIYAAWAKIYHSDEVLRKAKILKLHAFKRMGKLAEEIRKAKSGPKGTGPVQFLREQGFKKHTAEEIRAVSNAPDEAFNKAVNQPRPPSPKYFKNRAQSDPHGNTSANRLGTIFSFAFYCETVRPEDVVNGGKDKKLIDAIHTIIEWADRVEQLLDRKEG